MVQLLDIKTNKFANTNANTNDDEEISEQVTNKLDLELIQLVELFVSCVFQTLTHPSRHWIEMEWNEMQ